MNHRLTLLVCFVSILTVGQCGQTFFRTYKCSNGHCSQTSKPITTIVPEQLRAKNEHTTLAACRLICGETAGLWPIPTESFNVGNTYVPVNQKMFQLNMENTVEGVRAFISEAYNIFLGNLQKTCKFKCSESSTNVTVHVKVNSSSLTLNWDTNEAYSIGITRIGDKIGVYITGATVYGVRHGLETLSQLIAPVRTTAEEWGLVLLDSAKIRDKPVFVHRGLLLDSARNFLSVSDILRTIDAMAASKMNVLHWHATDSQSFPLEIKSIPLMAQYGAYSADKIYSTKDMLQIVQYGKARGVRVILELDSPAHAGAGWEWGPEAGYGELAVCVYEQPWRQLCVEPPCGQLNPLNPQVFTVLRNIYKDIFDIWGTDTILHLGGDEVFIPCWNASEKITTAMKQMGLGLDQDDFLKIWGQFHATQLKVIDEERHSPGRIDAILWTSHLTQPEIIEQHLDKNRFVIQTWVEADSNIPEELLDRGYRLIMSTKDKWYLDHGFWGITKYHTWREAYMNRLPKRDGVLGGEAAMWGEYVDGGALDSRIWPRTAAVAERLWSDPQWITTVEAEPRLLGHKDRLITRGIHPDPLSPEWCNQHEYQCT